MHKVNARSTVAAIVALAAVGCSEIQEPLVENTAPQLATGEFGGPRSVPTRGRIAFSSIVTGDIEIYSVLEDGTGLVRLTYSAGDDEYPTWSSDARKVAFVSERSGSDQIYVMNADGSGVKRLSSFSGGEDIRFLRWSPDGRRMAFTLFTPGVDGGDIYTVSSSGKNLLRLTNRAGFDRQPSWAPDSRSLLFASDLGGTYQTAQIVQINADGSNETMILACTAECTAPAWSPDRTRILFRQGQSVYQYLEGQGATLVRAGADAPVFSPDGVKIAFVDPETSYTAFTMNADHNNETQLTTIGASPHIDWGR